MACKKICKTQMPAISEGIEDKIHTIRGQRVMLDSDLAALYGVPTGRLNEQLKRNAGRFPRDFAFQLERQEFMTLISQIAISRRHGGRRKMPWVFTEHGAIMAASVLNSPRAIDASVFVVRAFVHMREILSARSELAEKFAAVEAILTKHEIAIHEIVEAMQQLAALPLAAPDEPETPDSPKPPIGFHIKEGAARYHRRRRNTT